MQTLIFLDIDGVLNTFQSIEAQTDTLSPECVRQLNQLVQATQAKVIVSSTWRRVHSLATIESRLKRHGFEAKLHGQTPYIAGASRAEEIRTWLHLHASEGPFAFVILDDQEDFKDLRPHHVQTSYHKGLTATHRQRAQSLLADQQ